MLHEFLTMRVLAQRMLVALPCEMEVLAIFFQPSIHTGIPHVSHRRAMLNVYMHRNAVVP